MPIRATLSHVFRPVGQGLFAQGRVRHQPSRRNIVSWVHDCGTDSAQRYLLRETDRARALLRSPRRLDLLIISHFDADHVNGLSDLLVGIPVGRVVLPHATPADRLLFVLASRAPVTAAYIRFLVNPAAYLRSLTTVEQIVFVDEQDDDPLVTPPPPEPEPDFPDRRAKERRATPEPTGAEAPPSDQSPHPADRHVGSGFPFVYEGFWEFLFFNRPGSVCPAGLRATVDAAVATFLALPEATRDYEGFVASLRAIYHGPGSFGTSGPARNAVSLITYAGPVGLSAIRHAGAHVYAAHAHFRLCGRLPEYRLPRGLLYTGDLKMDTALRDWLRARLEPWRWDNLGPLQVPHHGADSSWWDRPASEWRHRWSVFSARAGSLIHPGPATLASFPIGSHVRVNENTGFFWWYEGQW